MSIQDSTRMLQGLAKQQEQRHTGSAAFMRRLANDLEQAQEDANFPMEELEKLAHCYGFCVLHSDAVRSLLQMAHAAIENSEEPLTDEVQALVPLLELQVRGAASC